MAFNAEQWLAAQSAALGLDANEIAVAQKLMSNNKFKSDFVPTPDFHSTVDRVKQKYEGELSKVVQMNRDWQAAYETEYAPAVTALEKLQRSGFNVNGLEDNGDGGVVNQRGAALSAEDIDAMISARVDPIRETAISWGSFIADKAVEHRDQYGKPLDAEKLRQFGYENRNQYGTFQSAYEAFTAPERTAKQAADLEKWKTDEREKIRLEVLSSAGLPEFSGGLEGPSPAFMAADTTPELSRDEIRQSFARKFPNLNVNI